MIAALRTSFNAFWTEQKYRDVIHRLESRTGATLDFPISQTPGFFPQSLMETLASTGIQLIDQILSSPEAMTAAEAAVPERYRASTPLAAGSQGPEAIPTFAQVD